eukprot:212756-Prymnesium_polylepis.1
MVHDGAQRRRSSWSDDVSSTQHVRTTLSFQSADGPSAALALAAQTCGRRRERARAARVDLQFNRHTQCAY